ncbi:deleted in malignant brain tumors 1 protein-like isoform X2 [Haliotis rufescens]|nr:deleted in malignant brain tumors 1 protein-like isoform X2 [Haliotis rufescens]
MPFSPVGMKTFYMGVATVLVGLCLVLVCDAKPHSHQNWLRMSSLRKKRQAQSSRLAGTRDETRNTLGYDRDTTTNSTYTCDRVYHTTSGSLDTYSVSLAQGKDCEYIVRPPYYPFFMTLYLRPLYMTYNFMDNNNNCSGSYVEISGTQYCGAIDGQYSFSSDEAGLPVRCHHSVNSVTGRREEFSIFFNTRPLSCIVTLTNTTGYINSYPGNGYEILWGPYYTGTHCVFTIKVEDVVGQKIVFSLNQFHLEDPDNSTSVCNEYVDMNGEERLCGYQYGTRSFNFDGTFVITFTSDNSQTNMDFDIHYDIVPATCTATLSSLSGSIMSAPGDGRNYLDNTRCNYTFTATSYPRTITFTFTTFQLESHASCRYDYLQFNSGVKKCGTISNLVYTDTMNGQYRVTFYTDGSVTRRGFVASYQISDMIDVQNTTSNPIGLASNNGTCGTTLTSSTGRIYYPTTASYTNNGRCQVTIRPGAGQTFNVTFTDFDLEYQSSCNYDSLMFQVNGVNSSKTCGRNRAGLTLSFPYTSGDIVVNFRSDGSVTGRGFDLNYQVT